MYQYNNQQESHHRQPQLFDDTSGYQNNQDYGDYSYQQPQYANYNNQQQYQQQPPFQPSQAYGQPPPPPNAAPFGAFQPTQLINDPLIANAAMQYGQNLVGQGQEFIDKKLEKYMSVSKLKYYFAVDTNYVLKKIKLLFFPFTHSDWSVQFDQSEGIQVQPRHDVNAPDLYIPTMSFVTYILMVGLSLGLMDRFSPEILGLQASKAIMWLVLEILCVLLALHLNSGTVVRRPLHFLHVLALAGYKYPGMISMLATSMVLPGTGYYVAQAYCSLTLSLFMFRTLRSQIQNQGAPDEKFGGNYAEGSKRRFYLLIILTGLQPVLMWWLTGSVAYYPIVL